ncbi:FAD-binding protein [Immundisolibacter cernigliae]|uniref:Fumarate reductase n=1 Tax=Immundisolibacter cernigliae TaxID=1810504 RepID=A0A1B1YRG7_9GAMM|nr:FAD-binding protein [Immundisolibacter cernigliae]ANX03370.1 fumarate reductase [Immundisolibacter cernigliae]
MDRLELDCEVLVVGGGFGGAIAALRAAELGAKVILVEKASVARAGPSTYVHSQFAPDHRVEGDELTAWMDEFVVGANYLADQDWVRQYIVEAYDRTQQLIAWGVPYSRNADGSLKYVKVRGHRLCTTLGVDGRACMEVLRRRLKAARVKLVEKVAVIELLTSDGQYPTGGSVSGAIGVHVRTGQPHIFRANDVILNPGPFYPRIHYAFSDHCTGELHAAAWRIGAEFAGMEFAQFAAWSNFNGKFFTPGQAKIQGVGAHFINANGDRYMDHYDPTWGDLAGLFQIARATITENLEGRGPCHLDLRHVPAEDIAVLYEISPTVERAFKEFNIDPSKDLLELGPFVVIGTMSTSGPDIDLDAATNIPGLYVAGYGSSCPHLMSGISGSGISTFSMVCGYRAAEHAVRRSVGAQLAPVNRGVVDAVLDRYFKPMQRLRQVRPSDVWMAIGDITSRPTFALFKTAARIQKTIVDLEGIRNELIPMIFAPDIHELEKAHEVKNYLDLAILACQAMLERTESRGELFRVDHPAQDNDAWLKWLKVRRAPNGDTPVFSTRDLPFERWPIKPPTGRNPSPYTVPARYALEV